MGTDTTWYMVVLLGLGTVFIGLICLIFIIKLMSAILHAIERKNAKTAQIAAAAPAVTAGIPDRPALIAAVSACIATVMGTDVSGLRILSVKKVNG